MGTPGPQKINSYGDEFKLRAVQLSNEPGILVKDVAQSLGIHPFMLSKWRKQVRDGLIKGKVTPLDLASVGDRVLQHRQSGALRSPLDALASAAQRCATGPHMCRSSSAVMKS